VHRRAALQVGVLVLAFAVHPSGQSVPRLHSRAESSDYTETSRHDDVMRFANALAAESPLVRLESFGRSEEGRDLPLLVLGKRGLSPFLPRIFILANIHGGEVEGKEAALHLARRLALGDLRPLLDRVVVLIAPIYNADGNESITLDHRTMQNGPIGGVGSRENAKGLDLNRDFMKLESREARALVAAFNTWDPDLVLDLHTTNGSYHGYHLTYAPTLNPNADRRLIAYARDRLLPAVRREVEARHRFRTYYYGNFATREAPEREVSSFDGTPPVATRIWRTFDHRPRFGNNYIGLRNRLTILSEAYSYLDFRQRVAATEAFVEAILRYTAAHGAEIRRLVRAVDRARARGPRGEAGVAFQLRPLPEPVEILVGEVEKRVHPKSGREMLAMIESAITPVKMADYGVFEPVRRVPVPDAYILERAAGFRTEVDRIRDVLLAHGVQVDEFTKPVTLNVDRLIINKIDRAGRTFQGHNEARVAGTHASSRETFPPGSLVIWTRQPLGALAFYLLDPESDDGLTTWNFFDEALTVGNPHPVARLMTSRRLPTRRIRRG